MKVLGIIAEYNPLHKGHICQMDRARQITGADYIIVVMSGDYVQRGEPAIYDKYTRARMALNAGADLVLELPVAFATASAEDFALAGVSLLNGLGCVDVLCFGSEEGTLAPLAAAAKILREEPADFRKVLQSRLKEGVSYPAARAAALKPLLSGLTSDPNRLLASPNNILGIEYLKALRSTGSSMTPLTLQREGQDYHDREAPSGEIPSSATAIRSLISHSLSVPLEHILRKYLPAASYQALETEQATAFPIFPEDLSLLLQARLLDCSSCDRKEALARLSGIQDMSEELAARLLRQSLDFGSFAERVAGLKSKTYTYSRISRALLHTVLSVTAEQVTNYREQGCCGYARVLGFRKSSAPLLSAIKKEASLPLVTKTADAKNLLTPLWLECFQTDLYASHLYQALLTQKGRSMKNEYTKSVLVIP